MNLFGEEEHQEYQVLARKYRPKKLSELIGQDVLVQTIANAIEMNKIPHAFVLTGIRGVGKTSTARIIARSLLCNGADGKNTKPTKEPCGVCNNCVSIAEDRNVDVVEVDAASRTGVDDIREIIDQVVYAPVQGRYKVFIIDEVHMLSKNAFNALLKTLEEPPHHVKFIFATTEIRKIPVTILSRCMRFDLPRVSIEKLVTHFGNISEKEGAKVSAEALSMIAKASEGSVRDGLSLLDQAISISNGEEVTGEKVRNMLGLADRQQTLELFENIVEGNTEGSINIIRSLYNLGVEPVTALQDLLEIVHFITQSKISKEYTELSFVTESEKKLAEKYTGKIEISYLSRLWQMLTKGINEAKFTSNSLIAAEMIIVRICYGAALPTPEQILGRLDISSSGQNSANVASFSNQAAQKKTEIITKAAEIVEKHPKIKEEIQQEPALFTEQSAEKKTELKTEPNLSSAPNIEEPPVFDEPPIYDEPPAFEPDFISQIQPQNTSSNEPSNFLELAKLFKEKNEVFTAAWIEDIKPVSFDKANRRIEYVPSNLTPKTFSSEVSEKLTLWTGNRWVVTITTVANDLEAPKSIRNEKEELLEKKIQQAKEAPMVKEVLEIFPGSRVVNVQEIFAETPKTKRG